jgi:hypothetical protein
MNSRLPTAPGFKRQVVFRIGAEEWPLLEAAVSEHGSIQAAMLAGLRALQDPPAVPLGPKRAKESRDRRTEAEEGKDGEASSLAEAAREEEIPARTAADLLGLKPNTVRGYVRAGRLPGYYEGGPEGRGWLTTRSAVRRYKRKRRP